MLSLLCSLEFKKVLTEFLRFKTKTQKKSKSFRAFLYFLAKERKKNCLIYYIIYMMTFTFKVVNSKLFFFCFVYLSVSWRVGLLI